MKVSNVVWIALYSLLFSSVSSFRWSTHFSPRPRQYVSQRTLSQPTRVFSGFKCLRAQSNSRIGAALSEQKEPAVEVAALQPVVDGPVANWIDDGVFRPIHVKIVRKGDSLERKHVTDYTKSLVFVNDTYRCAQPSGVVPFCRNDAYRDRRDDEKTLFTLLGEFRIESPGFMHLLPALNSNDQPRLWVTNFGLTIGGQVIGVDVSGRVSARKCKAPFVWPNSVEYVPSGHFTGINTPAIMVADGFLVPGKTKGNVWFITDPGGEQEKAVQLVTTRSWFYHKAVPLKFGEHEGVLTARANLPMMPFSSPQGELVWIEKPNTLNPLASWNLPWREVVLASGPDVMFELVDLDPDDQCVEVFATEFFSRKLTMHSIIWDAKRKRPVVVERQVLDEDLGQPYSVSIADLQGEKSHLLVTTHEYEPDPTLDKTPLYWIPGTNSKWTYTSSPAPMGTRSMQDGNGTVGGSLFAYRVPRNWRKYRPTDELTEDQLIQRLPQLFRQVDPSGTGYVVQAQVEQAIKLLGMDPVELQDGELSRMLQDADWDGSGELGYQQFEGVMSQILRNNKRGGGIWGQALRRFEMAMGASMKGIEMALSSLDEEAFQARLPGVFAQIDRDSSGAIDMEEMKQAMLAMGVTCSDVELANMFMEADWDGNGLIEYPEFESLMLRIFFGVRDGGNVIATALNWLEAALKSTVMTPDAVKWRRSTLASGFRVKRTTINAGAPGFAYTFHPHASMEQQRRPPHILLAGDCADAAYVLQPVRCGEEEEPQYELLATLAFEGTVGCVAVGRAETESSIDDGWAKFFVPVYETDRVYMFKCGPPPTEGVEPNW